MSIVSVSKRIVTDTINVKDEPMDVVFAGTNAFVSVGRSNLINVYDVTSHHLVKSIPVFGGSPRYLAVSNDGSVVYASFTYSGNGTTALPHQYAPPPPPPTNSALPPAPQQDIIIQWNDPAYSAHIPFSIPDNDVVAISTSQLAVYKYFQTVGTILFGLAVAPNGDLWVANTDALNTVRFEPNVQGHFINNRLSKIAISTGAVTSYDLNPYMKGVHGEPAQCDVPLPGACAADLSGLRRLRPERLGGSFRHGPRGAGGIGRLHSEPDRDQSK